MLFRPGLILAAALAAGGCRCNTPLSAAELAGIRSALVLVNESSGTAQVHRFSPDAGTEPLTVGPRNHFPLAAWRGGVVIVASEGEGDFHLEEALWLGPDGGSTSLLAASRRARSVVPLPDALLMESGAEGFSEIVRVEPGQVTPLTSNPEGNFEPQALPGGDVIFVSSRDGNPELYRRPADGGTQQRLTQDPAEDLAPRVSPDGRTVAFLSSRRGSDELFLLPTAGGAARLLVTAPLAAGPAQGTKREAVQRDHSFSPDAKSLWFTARTGAGRLRIWRADVATGTATAFTDGAFDDDQPKLSADGRFVAWVSTRDGNPELYVARTDGSGVTRLTASPAADWLPLWR